MLYNHNGLQPDACFLSAVTGGGKSSVRDSMAVLWGGFTWCISPLLTLQTDQKAKISGRWDRFNRALNVINLDDYVKDSQRLHDLLFDLINYGPSHNNIPVVILCSPQSFCNTPIIIQMFEHHLTSGALTMVNVDEAHLFCQFGLFFRDEFLLLKKHMFDKLKVPQRSYLKVPVLFMTATANMAILKRLSGITGLTFKPQHVYWPPAPSMYDPRANIEVQYTDQPIRSLRRYFDLLQIGQAGVPKRQFLIVANSRAKIERTHADVQQYIDSQSPSIQIGTQRRQRSRGSRRRQYR